MGPRKRGGGAELRCGPLLPAALSDLAFLVAGSAEIVFHFRRNAGLFAVRGWLAPFGAAGDALAGLYCAGIGYSRAMAERENTRPKQGAGRLADGKFAAGSSGNPNGRPKGARNRATLIAQELLDGEGDAIVRRAIALAKDGDPVALRLCVERILPRRANVVEVALPSIRRAADVADACAAVIEAAAAGRISLAEAREFMALLDVQRRAIETHDLAVRIELLERGGEGVR
jgi:hypothetical protein